MAIPILLALLTLIPVILSLPPPYAATNHVLYTGEVLMAGQNLTNGRHRLAMQSNCELVLYDGENPAWSANTDGYSDDCYLGLKHNGELVVRGNVHYTLWSSARKYKKGKHALVLSDNGRLSVYGPRRWTSENPKELGLPTESAAATEYVLFTGQRLTPPNKLKNKDFELGFMEQCNLVISDGRSGNLLWQTSTRGDRCYLEMETSGELSVKRKSQRLWSNNRKYESGDYIAVLRFDGRLNVFGPLVWSINKHPNSVSSVSPSEGSMTGA